MEAKKYKRIFTIVIDSCGIGNAKDAAEYHDAGADTLGHIAAAMGGIQIPNMQKLGIANLKELEGIAPTEKPLAYYAKMNEASTGKDTMTWSLGDDGTSYHNSVPDIYGNRISKGTYRRTGEEDGT